MEQQRSSLLCAVRKTAVLALPEEIQRQKLILWLHRKCGVPLENMQVEVKVAHYRADLVVWKSQGSQLKPWLLAECKAPHVALEGAESQLVRYLDLGISQWILVTNGQVLKVWQKSHDTDPSDGESGTWIPSQETPLWNKP
jgi:hypothetical protein